MMRRKTKVRLERAKRRTLTVIKKLLAITVGALLIAVAYNALIIPYGLLSGGVGGLALIAKYTIGIPLYVGIFILNIPILLWGMKELDRQFMIYSLIGTVVLIVALPWTRPYIPLPDLDIFLASIFSGVVSGLGGGIVFKFSASTGGSDIIAMIMKKKKDIPVGAFSFYVNIVVLALSLFFFDLKIALYTAVSMWVGGKVTDFVLEGLNRNKSVVIISAQSELIAQQIMQELNRGVTYLEGRGAFSGESKQVINCVVNQFEMGKLREIVQRIDPRAFMFITETVEVSGKGFTR